MDADARCALKTTSADHDEWSAVSSGLKIKRRARSDTGSDMARLVAPRIWIFQALACIPVRIGAVGA